MSTYQDLRLKLYLASWLSWLDHRHSWGYIMFQAHKVDAIRSVTHLVCRHVCICVATLMNEPQRLTQGEVVPKPIVFETGSHRLSRISEGILGGPRQMVRCTEAWPSKCYSSQRVRYLVMVESCRFSAVTWGGAR